MDTRTEGTRGKGPVVTTQKTKRIRGVSTCLGRTGMKHTKLCQLRVFLCQGVAAAAFSSLRFSVRPISQNDVCSSSLETGVRRVC